MTGKKKKRKKKLRQVLPDLLAIYRYFIRDIRAQLPIIGGAFIAMLVGVLFRLLEPWPLKFVLDEVLMPDQRGASSVIGSPDSWSPNTVIIVVAGAVICIAILRAAADYTSRVGFFNVGNRIVIQVRNRVFQHLQQLPMKFHDRQRSGDLIVRVTRDVSLLRDVTATAILPLVASSLVLLGMIAVMFWLHWALALLALGIIPLYWISTVRIGRQVRETARKQREREAAMATVVSESIQTIRSIKSLSLEDKKANEFDRHNRKSQKDDVRASRLSLRLSRTVDILLAVSTAIVLWYGAHLVIDGSLTAGELVVFLVYLKRAFKPAQEFAKYTARIAKATAAGERVINLLERTAEPIDQPNARRPKQLKGDFEFRNVIFGYTSGRPVIANFNLSISAGQLVAVTGPSGAGKSTLLGLLLRLYEPDSGEIFIDGHDAREYSIRALRSSFRVVLQNPVLFAASIKENIAMGSDQPLTDDQISQAAGLALAKNFIEQLPLGFETPIGERGDTLSRGQRQRLAVARAAVHRHGVLLLDEPTTGLDETNRRLVCQSLLQLARGTTTILITHDLRLAAHADQVVYMCDGCVAERGTHQSLMRRRGHYRRQFEQQVASTQLEDSMPSTIAINAASRTGG